ncbi:Ldh family oxidoreductase [Enterovirga aerilata]|uniref:Ldh family oxidoreductase n=1 Tax=Enterovirga aerilata TaxID=2730920 RepID=A0A849HVW4_9HYPH|nr:Ldh family oxidoreductase [Enterovirga sp. DB1703]NNM71686.1 Ldh family oxidoreductase [Enterovirga sp. DB1703]
MSIDEAEEFAAGLLVAAGVAPAPAAAVARHLASSDASGYQSHGLSLLPLYVAEIRAGRVDPAATGRWLQEAGPILVVDGERGLGASVAYPALSRAAEVARAAGVALLAIRNTHHLGRIGAFAEAAAEQGLVSLHFCNVVGRDPVVVPAGGREPRFVTNPLAIGIPRAGDFPVVLDIATSGIALNKARVANDRGERVEPGYLIDAEGRPTTDPGVLFREPKGALLPFGGHKGSGLAILGELLAGAVTGGRTIAPRNIRDGAILNNMLSVLIDPGHLAGDGWHAEAEELLAYIHGCAPVDPRQPVLVPGEPEALAREAAVRDGITYPGPIWGALAGLAAELGVGAEPRPAEAQRKLS